MIVNFNRKKLNELSREKCKLNKKRPLALILGLTMFLTGCNRTVFDTKYRFDKAVVFGDGSSIILDVEKWKDYSGEQIQLTTNNGLTLLTSSFDTNCFYGKDGVYSASNVASNASEEVYHLTNNDDKQKVFNKDIIDTVWGFNKSITFNGNRALILPIGQWRDYSGEQIQVVTNDGLTILLSSYNSKLVNDSNSEITADAFASCYVSGDGSVVDLSNKLDRSILNYDFVDFNLNFNKAIIMKDNSIIILPISEWNDYEGEQLQIKIVNGPTMVTAAYDTILLNDANSQIKAIDVAKALGENVVDLASEYNKDGVLNKTIFDFNNGFSNVIFSNDNTSTILPITEWCDYEGEQLQVKFDEGNVILSSSLMLDLINGGTSKINASTIGSNYVFDGKIIDESKGDITKKTYNKTIIDFEQKFQYALKVINGNVTIIPLKKWKDFYNHDGSEEEEDSPNCEQIQLILPDDTAIVTTAYDTLLVKNVRDIWEIAEFFRSKNGVICDLTPYVGEPNVSGWNFSLFDTRYTFNYAILNNNGNTQIFPVKNWLDFSEGEQLQLNFYDNTGLLTSFVNTSLVSSKTSEIVEIIADAFSGSLQQEKSYSKKLD